MLINLRGIVAQQGVIRNWSIAIEYAQLIRRVWSDKETENNINAILREKTTAFTATSSGSTGYKVYKMGFKNNEIKKKEHHKSAVVDNEQAVKTKSAVEATTSQSATVDSDPAEFVLTKELEDTLLISPPSEMQKLLGGLQEMKEFGREHYKLKITNNNAASTAALIKKAIEQKYAPDNAE